MDRLSFLSDLGGLASRSLKSVAGTVKALATAVLLNACGPFSLDGLDPRTFNPRDVDGVEYSETFSHWIFNHLRWNVRRLARAVSEDGDSGLNYNLDSSEIGNVLKKEGEAFYTASFFSPGVEWAVGDYSYGFVQGWDYDHDGSAWDIRTGFRFFVVEDDLGEVLFVGIETISEASPNWFPAFIIDYRFPEDEGADVDGKFCYTFDDGNVLGVGDDIFDPQDCEGQLRDALEVFAQMELRTPVEDRLWLCNEDYIQYLYVPSCAGMVM